VATTTASGMTEPPNEFVNYSTVAYAAPGPLSPADLLARRVGIPSVA
jgi:hypothetical protein